MPKLTITIGIDDSGPDICFKNEAAYLLLVCADVGLERCPEDFASEDVADAALAEVRSVLTRFEEIRGDT